MNGPVDLAIPPDEPTTTISHVVPAPPALVFDAWTNTDRLPRWWGPREQRMTICEVDLRVGGTWHFASIGPNGVEHGFHGEYRVIEQPGRLVATFVYEGAPEHEAVDEISFTAVEGGTLVTVHTTHASVLARDWHVASGMESGMRQTFARLDELCAVIG
jgi:uncharacterized protein YndB with AHSA1/START domain